MTKQNKIGVIVAARMGSSRLPGKALKILGGEPMILFLLQRLKASKQADQIIVATTEKQSDDILVDAISNFGLEVFRGDQDDVVARFVEAADYFGFDQVVRITGDCPFVDAELLDFVLSSCGRAGAFDLATTKGLFPVGLDFEIYSADLMKELHLSAKLTVEDREHLTWHMARQPDKFILHKIAPPEKWQWKDHPFTVDTTKDFEWASLVAEKAGGTNATILSLIAAAKAVTPNL
jgi:spore coat polysaccharide biosynthesis protein SpsF